MLLNIYIYILIIQYIIYFIMHQKIINIIKMKYLKNDCNKI